jgi:hypothetical protein
MEVSLSDGARSTPPSYHVATCTMTERHDESRTQILTHFADCLQGNHQIRTEAGDITLTSLAFLGEFEVI